MKLVMQKSEMDDWYAIERAEHDGREWLRQTGKDSFSLECSARISDADVEGTGHEMLSVARAILDRSSYSAKRCAVRIDGDVVLFRSPRNSRRDAEIPYADAEALAHEIIEQLDPGGEGTRADEGTGQ